MKLTRLCTAALVMTATTTLFCQESTTDSTHSSKEIGELIKLDITPSPTMLLRNRNPYQTVYNIRLRDRRLTHSDHIAASSIKSLQELSDSDSIAWRTQDGFLRTQMGNNPEVFYRLVGLDKDSKRHFIRIENKDEVKVYYVRHPQTFGVLLDPSQFPEFYRQEFANNDETKDAEDKSDLETSLLQLDKLIYVHLNLNSNAQKVADYMSGIITGKHEAVSDDEAHRFGGNTRRRSDLGYLSMLMGVAINRLNLDKSNNFYVYQNNYSKSQADFEKELISFYREKSGRTVDEYLYGIGKYSKVPFFGVIEPIARGR